MRRRGDSGPHICVVKVDEVEQGLDLHALRRVERVHAEMIKLVLLKRTAPMHANVIESISHLKKPRTNKRKLTSSHMFQSTKDRVDRIEARFGINAHMFRPARGFQHWKLKY